MTTVGVAGTGPAREAVAAALADTRAEATGVDPAALGQVDVGVCVGAGDEIQRVAAAAWEAETPLVAVELGGIGGRPVAGVDAAVSGHAPGTACYECLRQRVAAVDADTAGADVDAATARFAGAVAGREVAVLAGGGESPVLGSVLEVPHARRRVLSVPGCRCGADPDRSLDVAATGGRDLETALASAEAAFDARLGPVTEVGEVESFPVPYYMSTLAATPFADADPPDHAAGVAADWDPAFMKALGEALERYSAAVYRTDSFATAPESTVDPGRFVHPGETLEADAVEQWYPATRLDTGESTFLPAELVVFPPPQRRIRPAITTGLGLGNDTVEALLSGLYEIVERDAAMLSWYSTYEPVGLAVDDDGYGTLSARARSEDLTVTALSLTQDVDVPVVAACVHREGEWPQFAAGMAADLDPEAAARDALEEALQNWIELRRMGPDRAADEAGAIGPAADFPAPVRAFADPDTTVPATSVGPEDPPTGRAELDAVVDRLAAAGLAAYGARLTPGDVEALGFEAVRAVVPAAQPLFTDDPYFGDRAREVPASFGYEARLDRDHHPFP